AQLHQHDSRLLRRGLDRPQRRERPCAARGCSGVVKVAEPVSPSYRSRVRKVSCTYRSQCVAHLPELHTAVSWVSDLRVVDLRIEALSGEPKRGPLTCFFDGGGG